MGLTPKGAAIGGAIGGAVGGVIGGLIGGGGGTLVAPGVGTIGGGVAGAGEGAVNGAVIGAVIGDVVSDAIKGRDAANDDTYQQCPKVGDNQAAPPGNCAAWKAQVLSQKENAEMLFLITENPMLIANVNYQIRAYNASCQFITGKVDILLIDLNNY